MMLGEQFVNVPLGIDELFPGGKRNGMRSVNQRLEGHKSVNLSFHHYPLSFFPSPSSFPDWEGQERTGG